MSWLTAKHRVKLYCAAAALLGTSGVAMAAGSDTEQFARFKDPTQWGAPAGDLNQTRYSALKDINTENVKDLQFAWSQSSGTLRGHEGQPLVIERRRRQTDDVSSRCGWPNIVQALDLTDPGSSGAGVELQQDQRTATNRPCRAPAATRSTAACRMPTASSCSAPSTAMSSRSMRRPAKKPGSSSMRYPDKGETITPAPIIANDKVMIGFGGDEFAARGRFTAYDLADGKKVWECHSTGPDKDVCLTPNTNKKNPHYGTAGKDLGIQHLSG